MDLLALFQQDCEELSKRNGRIYTTEWIDGLLESTIAELKKMPLFDESSDDNDKRLHSLEQLLLAIVLGNKGLDARASVAWRNVGRNLGCNYLQELSPIENQVAHSILMLTGHVKEKSKKFNYKRSLKILGATVAGGLALAVGGALGAAAIGTALAGSAAGTSAFLMSTTGMGVVAGVFGAVGANRTAWKMIKREGGLKEFMFVPVKKQLVEKVPNDKETIEADADESYEQLMKQLEHEPSDTESQQKLHCAIGISGWLLKQDLAHICNYWSEALVLPSHETWAVVFDRKVLEAYGNALRR
jgi:hypothetical protein